MVCRTWQLWLWWETLCVRVFSFVNYRYRWLRTLVASSIAFSVVLGGAFFLIESVRAGGAVIVSAIVGLAAYLVFTAPNPTQARGQSVSVLMVASAIAIAVGIAGFAVAVVLLGLTGF